MTMYFDFTEKEAKDFIKSLDELHIDYDFEYLFDDEAKEVGYSIIPYGCFNVKYDD